MQENKNRTASTIFKQLVSLGDSSGQRYSMGFYNDRRLVYKPIPTTYAYKQKIYQQPDLTRQSQGQIDPWEVTPAEWVFYPDFQIGTQPPTTLALLQADDRAGFIETVEFSLPANLSINGVKVNTLNQLLARLSLGADGV